METETKLLVVMAKVVIEVIRYSGIMVIIIRMMGLLMVDFSVRASDSC